MWSASVLYHLFFPFNFIHFNFDNEHYENSISIKFDIWEHTLWSTSFHSFHTFHQIWSILVAKHLCFASFVLKFVFWVNSIFENEHCEKRAFHSNSTFESVRCKALVFIQIYVFHSFTFWQRALRKNKISIQNMFSWCTLWSTIFHSFQVFSIRTFN